MPTKTIGHLFRTPLDLRCDALCLCEYEQHPASGHAPLIGASELRHLNVLSAGTGHDPIPEMLPALIAIELRNFGIVLAKPERMPIVAPCPDVLRQVASKDCHALPARPLSEV
ncbi:MAG: hypothetical protein A3B28_00585 [Candidatus Wildermuthbacteria bacterium RIFCSPLOWO2_01_FULL_50_46]|nr:MAG: hypothetical protein A3B28_00585 [Candidatus Wildermuthbacteria bacterium RIFCSPLOWO2_01_FULL_50_46]